MKKIFFKISAFVFFLFSIFYFLPPISYASIPGCFCDASSSCYPDGCTRKPIKNDGTVDYGLCGSAGCGGAYNCCYDTNSTDANRYFCTQQPPCCLDMVARNNPEACCWPERGYCHPFYCQQVSRPEKCGWYWSYHEGWSEREFGYGCTKGTSAANLQPVFGLPAGISGGQPTTSPTQPPQPTNIPPTSIPPTAIPTPTKIIIPTTIPTRATNFPTYPPLINPTKIMPTASLPQVTFGINAFISSINNSIANIKISIAKTAIASKKILDLPSYAGNKILSLDQHLEMFMNELIEQIRTSTFSHETRSRV
ncbi:hypothetical protein AUK04_03480 [Candidatus Roizmanbacteria bacterium CG2_30_33_16]|uniref:Uncharacterized protein n=1 Tax=Candidatus Roizmanbacteria bacterium CG2_30_33_16 TaxID=1805340 RepID=A0A1J5HTT0_9BACT|nr:hypothetical protein [Candidatus Roizmanbacteria bacterium]OIP83438.1 MAG: hypothetical protein AUK04_03480 [Candidatus Roizmanbacteria bacterium CG2_30_33_16]